MFSEAGGDRLNASNVGILITAHKQEDGRVMEAIEAAAATAQSQGMYLIVIGGFIQSIGRSKRVYWVWKLGQELLGLQEGGRRWGCGWGVGVGVDVGVGGEGGMIISLYAAK